MNVPVINKISTLAISVLVIFSGPVYAESTATGVDGAFNNSQENACLSMSMFYYGSDCSYENAHKEINGNAAPWVGPTEFAVYYPIDSPNATPKFTPSASDDRMMPTLSGVVSVEDMGTSSPEDDMISAELIIGAAARSFLGRPSHGGKLARGVESWQAVAHSLSATTVSEAHPNDSGGFDYVIGSKGFPARLCQKADPTDCFPSSNAPQLTLGKWGVDQWSEPALLPIARGKMLGGNVGGETTVTVTDYSCEDAVGGAVCGNVDFGLSWGPNGTPLTNLLLRVSTDERGRVLSVKGFWTVEHRFGVGNVVFLPTPVGENDSWWGGFLQLTGIQQ